MGLQLARYSDSTLVAPLRLIVGGDKDYIQRFQAGTAEWFHLPLSATEYKAISRQVMCEVRYCAIAVNDDDSSERMIAYLYKVKSVRLVRRCDMDNHQAGKIEETNEEECWFFELAYARPLELALIFTGLEFQLTKASELLATKNVTTRPLLIQVRQPAPFELQ
jgi:hypothetical protein